MLTRVPSVSIFPLGAVLLAGCGSDAPSIEVSVRDSAGMTIVENPGAQASIARWSLSAEPTLTLGMRDGPEEYLFHRIAAAFVLPDERIVVADGGSAEFRFYDLAGRFLQTAGGRGDGPGELRVMFRVVRLPGDTLVAVDLLPGRLDFFDAYGRFLRRETVNLQELIAPPYFGEGSHFLPDRSFLLLLNRQRDDLPEGSFRPRIGLLRYDPATRTRDTIGWFGGLENFVVDVGGRTVARLAPFARRTVATWTAQTLYVADTDRYEIRAVDLATETHRLIRRISQGPSVTARDRDRFVERFRRLMERSPRPQADLERWLAAVEYPGTKPPIRDLATDRLGNLWVAETPAERGGAITWAVFTPGGRLEAQIELADGLAPLEIGRDYLLGRWRDVDGVEFVRLYGLVREHGTVD